MGQAEPTLIRNQISIYLAQSYSDWDQWGLGNVTSLKPSNMWFCYGLNTASHTQKQFLQNWGIDHCKRADRCNVIVAHIENREMRVDGKCYFLDDCWSFIEIWVDEDVPSHSTFTDVEVISSNKRLALWSRYSRSPTYTHHLPNCHSSLATILRNRGTRIASTCPFSPLASNLYA